MRKEEKQGEAKTLSPPLLPSSFLRCAHTAPSSAWNRHLQEFEEEAAWHLRLSETLRKKVCQQLVDFANAQKKDHKTVQKPVEKAYENFTKVCRKIGRRGRCSSS